MKAETVSVNKIKPYENNPRNNDDTVDVVTNSIEGFGWQRPIVVDNGGVIIAGHKRYKTAKKLGYKEAPIVATNSFDCWQRFNNCEPIIDLHKYK